MESARPIVELKQVTYQVAGKDLVQDIRWTIWPGEHWAVLGPNGAGKSTLLKLAAGYLWPNRHGTVRWQGASAVDLRTLRAAIGWVTADLARSVPPREPVRDTVASGRYAQVGLFPTHHGDRADRHRVENLLTQIGCSHLADRSFETLSQGEQQLVLIARSQMAHPWLVVLDEPCAGLDPGHRQRLLKRLANWIDHQRDCSVVFVTHHVEEILPSITRVLALKDGRVLAQGATGDVLTPELLAELYDTSVPRIERYQGRLWPIWDGDD